MAKVVAKRVTADIEGDFVVFLMGTTNQQAMETPQVAPHVHGHAKDDS
jgi:hypothetical protein